MKVTRSKYPCRLEKQKIELEKEMIVKKRSEPDGKRVGYFL